MTQTPEEMKRKAWAFFLAQGLTKEGTAGLMGNLVAESAGFYPNRVEFLCLRRLREAGKIYTDATYTAFVDDGTITREEFLHPLPGKIYGYALAQWSTPARKAGLYDLCKSRGVSIADLQAQLDYLMYELTHSYPRLLALLRDTRDILAASNAVLTQFEQPADTGAAVRQIRYSYAKQVYDAFHQGGDDMGTETAISKVIKIAEQEIGYLEKKSNADLDSKTANAGSGNFTKYWRDTYPQYQGQPWCADFVSWCMMKAFGLETAKKLLQHWPFVYCPTLAAKTTNKTPVRGSVVLFYRGGTYAHTGLVTAVNGNTITTIEGNTSGASGVIPNGGGVCKKSYGLSGLSAMTKYYVPDYSIVSGEDTDMMYYVRSSWLDTGSQTFKGLDLSKAKASARKNKQLYVFDATGKIIWPVHKTVKARIERAVLWANAVAKDPRHGYDNREGHRWAQHGDFACSTLVITAYDQAGVPVRSKGATVTANMRDAFIAAGFKDVTASVDFRTCKGMERGDVLLTPGEHTEIYIGSKRLIGARGNATGSGPENGKPGDQGGEIVKGAYYDYPWKICLRYVGLPKTHKVQAGSFSHKDNAVNLQKAIKAKTGAAMAVTRAGGWYVVRSEAMTKDEAEALKAKLRASGFDAVTVSA